MTLVELSVALAVSKVETSQNFPLSVRDKTSGSEAWIFTRAKLCRPVDSIEHPALAMRLSEKNTHSKANLDLAQAANVTFIISSAR